MSDDGPAPERGTPVVTGPIPLASPVRGLRDFRARVRAARRDGVPLPDSTSEEDLHFFRARIEDAVNAGINGFLTPVATVEYGEEVHVNLLRLREFSAAAPGLATIAAGVPDIERVAREGRVALIPHFQGMQMVEADLGLVPGFRAAGVGIMTLTHHWKTAFGDGVFERSDQGLTARGRMAVEALNEHGVVLDLSHVGRRTSVQAMETSRDPVLFSHSNAAGVFHHPMNLTDEQLDRCAAGGGVVGVSAFPAFVSESTTPGVEQVLAHLDYLVDRMGVDHVALGLDFDDAPRGRFPADPVPDPPYAYPPGLAGPGSLPDLRKGIRARGYGEVDVEKLFGGNLLRLFRRVWHGGE